MPRRHRAGDGKMQAGGSIDGHHRGAGCSSIACPPSLAWARILGPRMYSASIHAVESFRGRLGRSSLRMILVERLSSFVVAVGVSRR